jgi:hypothetical protein
MIFWELKKMQQCYRLKTLIGKLQNRNTQTNLKLISQSSFSKRLMKHMMYYITKQKGKNMTWI